MRSRCAGATTCPIAPRSQGDYRWYNDTWGITRQHGRGFVHAADRRPEWIFDAHYRFYMQNAAEFYSDLFPRQNFQNFLARDKELSTMTSQTRWASALGYEFKVPGRIEFLQQGHAEPDATTSSASTTTISATLRVTGVAPGTEPLYSFDANVIRFFFSGWF